MAIRRLALYLAGTGYLVVVWYNAWGFAPLHWGLVTYALYKSCPMCGDMMGTAWWNVIMVRAPVNAFLWGASGQVMSWLFGLAVRTSR